MLFIVFLAVSAPAATVKPLSWSELVARSDAIVVGTAVHAVSRYEEGGRTIRTYVTFNDLTLLKGVPGTQVMTLRLEGGRVGDTQLVVSGMPVFKMSRRYLLFVRGNGKHVSPITGYNQGVFEILRERGRQVLKNLDGLEVIGIAKDRLVFAARCLPRRAVEPAPAAVPVPDAFKPAHPDVEALEAEMKQRRNTPAPPKVPRVHVANAAPGPADRAAPPPVPAAVRTGAAVPVTDVRPIVVPADRDPGVRMTPEGLMNRIRKARRGGGK